MCNLKLNCFIDVFVQLGRVHQALNTIFIYYHLITFLWRMCQQTVTYVHIQHPQSYFCIYLDSCFWQLDKFKSHIKSLSLFFFKAVLLSAQKTNILLFMLPNGLKCVSLTNNVQWVYQNVLSDNSCLIQRCRAKELGDNSH